MTLDGTPQILQVTQKCNHLKDISESIVNFALKFLAFLSDSAFLVQKPFMQSDWKDFIFKALWVSCPF